MIGLIYLHGSSEVADVGQADIAPVALLVIAGLAALAFFVRRAGRNAAASPPGPTAFGAWTAPVALALSFGAGAIHFAVIGDHFAEFPPYGVLFAALAWFQVGWGAAYLHERSRNLALAGIAVNVGAVAVWAVSRTTGLPFGPDAWLPEPIGSLDLLSSAFEIALAGVLARSLAAPSGRPGASLAPGMARAVVGSVVVLVVGLSSAAFATAGTGGHASVVDHASHAVPSPTGATAESSASPAPDGTAAPPALTTAAPTPEPPAPLAPGTITFGTRIGLGGELVSRSATFRLGVSAAWVVNLARLPATPTLRFMIVEILPDGRLFEHWRQDVVMADPAARQFTGAADLSAYAHSGAGTYRMRYQAGEEILAEGEFTLIP